MRTQDQILEVMRNQLNSRPYLQANMLQNVRKALDEMNNSLSQGTMPRGSEVPNFKEQFIELLLHSLGAYPIGTTTTTTTTEILDEFQKSKMVILEILEREFVSSRHNNALFQKLYQILQKDNENVAIQASKALDTLIKKVSENNVHLEKTQYLKIFELLKQKTEFLLKLSDHVKDPQYSRYRRNVQQRSNDRLLPLPNYKSLKFLNQLPNLFVHLMAYVDVWREGGDENRVKQLLRESINNIIQALRRTPYQQFYENMTQDFNSQLFGVMTKLLQFLFILLKNDKDSDRRESPNKFLKHHMQQQVEYIKMHQVLTNYIYLLKNCPDDFQISRYEIVNRLKLLMNNLAENRLKKQQAAQIIKQVLNEQVIFGKNKFLGQYSKNAICNFWIDTIRSPILLHHMFPPFLCNVRNLPSSPSDDFQQQFRLYFDQVDRLFQSTFKTIFDNSLYLSVQERSLELMNTLIEKLFSRPAEAETINYLNSCSSISKKYHQYKLNLMTKVLNVVAQRFGVIKNVFEQVSMFVKNKLGMEPGVKRQPFGQQKMEHIQIHTLPSKTGDEAKWEIDRAQFIESASPNFDSSLLTLPAVQNKFLMIYEQQQELCFNSHPIKMSNYYNYMKDAKMKVVDKCITVANKLVEIFIHQNLEQHSPADAALIKTVFFYSHTKKKLTEQQCDIMSKLLQNGLKVFEILHDYNFHQEDPHKKGQGHLKTFMTIFAQIYDPINFRDIVQPNMDLIFRQLLKYAKYCSQYCLQWVLIEPFCSIAQMGQFNKNIVELLIYNLIIKLEYSADQLDPFNEFYEYKDDYFSLLQKLIRFPFRCLSRYNDDSFIRNYFRQIVLFLVKKAHISRFSLDYLHLMRTLFKNILYNSNRQTTSPLFNQFFAICSKTNSPQPQQPNQAPPFSPFVNVNVLENLHNLFQTGIPQLADIVTQLIIMLPLKSKHIIQYAKQGFIVRPLLHCLCMMADYNYTLRTIKTFEIIVSHSSAEEISGFMDSIKDKLINRLLEIVSQSKLTELRPDKMSQDLSSLSLKLLAKLGATPRLHQQTINVEHKDQQDREMDQTKFQLVCHDLQTNKKLKTSMFSAIEYSIEICNKLVDQYYQAHILLSVETLQTAFNIMRQSLPFMLEQLHPMSQKLITVFSSMLSLHSKYFTISPNLLSRVRDGVREDITKLANNVTTELIRCGLTDYSKLFIKCLVISLNERVLITRQDCCINEISQEPKGFLWDLLGKMLRQLDSNNRKDQHDIYTYIIGLLLSQCLMISNSTGIGQSQGRNNYILPYKHAALSVLHEMIDMAPQRVLYEMSLNIVQGIFISASTIPDILNLKILQYPEMIAQKLFTMLLKNKVFLTNQLEHSQEIFKRVLDNLLGYSAYAHRISMNVLKLMSKFDYINILQMLYGGKPWSEIEDTSSWLTLSQSKFSLTNIREKNTPLTNIIKKIQRILNNVTEKTLRDNENSIKLMANAFRTIEWLISIQYKGKTYQAFTLIMKKVDTGKPKQFKEDEDQEEFDQKNMTYNSQFAKLISLSTQIIAINDAIFGMNIKIINDNQTQPQNQPPAANVPQNIQNKPAANIPNVRNRQGNPASTQQQNHSINPLTFFDDEQYRLNIEDIDMEIKLWGQLISSIANFLKATLLNQNIFHIVKINAKKKNEKSVILQRRSDIIYTLFNLVARVDRTVRNTAYSALKQLLAKEDHPKELLPSDEKLKSILRPILICLQHDFKKFMPSFLYVFRKILKLLTQCFNNALIIKLLNHLTEIDKAKQAEMANPTVTHNINYAYLMHQAKCISSLLGLFQYLSFAFQSTTPKHTVNSILAIMNYTSGICKYYAPKLGKHTIKVLMKENLAKLVNTMSPWFSVENLFGDASVRKDHMEMISEIIRMPGSYAIREKITREPTFADKILDEKHSHEDYLSILEILRTFSMYNTRWLRKNSAFAKKLIVRFTKAVNEKLKNDSKDSQINNKSQIRLLCKILVVYMEQNPTDTSLLFELAKALRIRSTVDFNFLRIFFKYRVFELYSIKAKREIFLQFIEMMKNNTEHIETKVACSFYIIYPLLLKTNQSGQTKQIFASSGNETQPDPIKCFIDLMKHALNSRTLQSRQGGNADRSSNNYRVAIEVLQLSSFVISPLKQELTEHKRDLLGIIWTLLKVEDKMLKNYAFICTSNFIRIFNIEESNKVLSIYLTLLRGLQALTQYDYEVGALNKKSLNILIPYWQEHHNEEQNSGNTGQQNMTWITWTLRMLHEDTSQPFRLVRFWQIVVKNHEIFQKFKESKFETQMINSMQWLMVTSNPAANNPLVKKIASDLSFIYIQWKYRDTKKKLEDYMLKIKDEPRIPAEEIASNRRGIIDESMNEKAAEICLNFFIKVAFFNSTDKEDKDIMRRSLYLLKKMLILWPNTRKRFEQIKNLVQKMKSLPTNQPAQQPPLRFHYTLLNIVNILMEFQSDAEIAKEINNIFKLFELGQLPINPPPRNNTTIPQPNNNGLTIYTINNPYLLHLVCSIVKRLVRVAYERKDDEQSITFLNEIKTYVRQGLDAYVISSNKNRTPPTPPQRQASNRSILKIQLVISFIRILFEYDPSSIDPCLNNLKQVASIFKRFFEGRAGPNKAPDTLVAPEGTFKQMLIKQSVIPIQLFSTDGLLAADQNFQKENLSNYSYKRLFLVIVMRILAAKFNQFHPQDRAQILEQMIQAHQKLPDPDLKIEIINIWKCMLIGPNAFPNGQIPERYNRIAPINFGQFSLKKVFFYLFQDNSKFYQHFQRRKIKPSDTTYNVNEKIYEQLLTRMYFDFLCLFIKTYRFNGPEYLEKIRIFVLYASKVCEPAQLRPAYDLIEKSYGDNTNVLYMLLFEDFKQLYCAEDYLNGDEVMLFFTRFLFEIASRNSHITFEIFGVDRPNQDLLNNYHLLLKSDQTSTYYNKMLTHAFELSVSLLPKCQNLPKIVTQYLLKANLNHTWGMALLKIVIDAGVLTPQQLYMVCVRIGQWGLLQKQLQRSSIESSRWVLDQVHKEYGDKDTIYGYRMSLTPNQPLKNSYLQLQQRQYYQSLYEINQYLERLPESGKRQREDMEAEYNLSTFQAKTEKTFASDIVKQCYKNLNQWDTLSELNKNSYDMETKFDYLFCNREDKEKIRSLVGEIENIDFKWLTYYYGKSLLSFNDTPANQKNKESSKETNVCMISALVQWLCLPKNAKQRQNEILVKTQCLLELEQGYKIKEESVPTTAIDIKDANYDALTRVVQAIFNEINTWRERLPHKFESMTIWRTILEQRNTIFINLKKRMHDLLQANLKTNNIQQQASKLLVPYTDIEWNNLRLIKQQRTFGVFTIGDYKIPDQSLYLDQVFLKNKELYYYQADCKGNYDKAALILNEAIGSTDDPLYKIEYMRLKARLLGDVELFRQASNIFSEASKSSQEQLCILWRDWLDLSYKAYLVSPAGSKIDWFKSAISTLPYALRYQPQKTRLQLAQLFKMIYENLESAEASQALQSVIEDIPAWTLLIWLPQIHGLAFGKHSMASVFGKVIFRLGVYFPQPIFYAFRQFKPQDQKLKELQDIRRNHYNLYSKLELLVSQLANIPNTKNNRLPISYLGQFAQYFSQLHVPLFDTLSYRSDTQHCKLPFIVQLGQVVQTEIRNNRSATLITILGSDSKQYLFRVEKRQSNMSGIMSSQCIDILNNHLEYSRQSFIRKLKLQEVKKIFISQEICLMATSPHTTSLLDILNEHMSKTSFGEEYPDNDKSYLKLPKAEVNKAINRRMREIVPHNLLEQYFMGKTKTLDDYYLFRKQFGLLYAPTQLLQYMFSNESLLSDFIVSLNTAVISIDNFKIRPEFIKASPYSVRLSRNIQHFLTDTTVYGGVLPGMVATTSAFLEKRLYLSQYLSILFADLYRINKDGSQVPGVSENYHNRLKQLLGWNAQQQKAHSPIPSNLRIILETGKKIGQMDNIPTNLKYWF